MSRRTALVAVLLLAGCAAEGERTTFADLHPGRTAADRVAGNALVEPAGLHHFSGGWYPPDEDAALSWGRHSTIELSLLGSGHRLDFTASAHPLLVERGISVSLEFNGATVGQFEPAVEPLTVSVDLPASVLRQGANTFGFRTSTSLGADEGVDRPWTLRLERLTVDGILPSHARERWASWSEPARPDPSAGLRIPGEVDLRAAAKTPGPEDPDVLMIVLDALRADRVGALGYDRDTTPTLDRLADGGVALTRVFAEAPYTRSSIATVFSAHSWRDHQVLGTDDALGSHFTTLAELLQEHGWQTWAVSDNSNVARSAGSAQGFAEFVQTWSDVDLVPDDPDQWWWPEKPVIVWEQRLAEGFDPQRPVFAYLHLMPPHEPYFPGPAHDRFGDAGYRGPVTGTTEDIRAFDRGRYARDSADHARLEALYDGGLRRGDALVARALDAWEGLGRDRPTLVVVLSDHGEAFGEHQRYGHNTSPYDEMTHVPVILHPRRLVPASLLENAGALRSLADVYPILVHTLGLRLPAGTVWPRRVLDVVEDPGRARDEVFIRCGTPRFGRRTVDGFWEYEPARSRRWYDLAADPGAQQDLTARDPDGWAGGMRAIREFLASPVSLEGAEPADLSDEDLERLRALGYTGGR